MSRILYISIDVEADGPIPGPNSMLSFGAAAFHLDHFTPSDDGVAQAVGTFEANLYHLIGANSHPDTMEWWARNQAAYDATRLNQRNPLDVMPEFVSWAKKLAEEYDARPVLTGYPIAYDHMFVYWYTVVFAGYPTIFGHQGYDIKTLASERLDLEYKQVIKRRMRKHWYRGCPKHTHNALDDALEQGILLMNILSDPK